MSLILLFLAHGRGKIRLADSRRGKNTQFPFTDSAGRDGNPSIAAWLVTKILTTPKGSPRTRTREAGPVGSERVWERGTALTSRLQTFETEMLAEEENFAGLWHDSTGNWCRLTRRLFGAMLGRIAALPSPAG